MTNEDIVKDFTIRLLQNYAQGNPGAAIFLTQLLKKQPSGKALLQITDLGIKGTNLYVLWNDIAGKDFKKLYKVLGEVPKEILIEACSKQDRSGLKIINNYFKTKTNGTN